jgi:hypothetical protein
VRFAPPGTVRHYPVLFQARDWIVPKPKPPRVSDQRSSLKVALQSHKMTGAPLRAGVGTWASMHQPTTRFLNLVKPPSVNADHCWAGFWKLQSCVVTR